MKKLNVNFSKPSQQQLNTLLEYYQTGRHVDAEKLSLSITQEFPKHQFAWKVLAVVLKLTGRISESLVASQKSVQLGPLDAEAHYNLGNTLKEQGRLEEAEASYRQAITLKPDFAVAHNNLGVMLQELGRLDEAEASCRQAIELKPDYAEAHYNLGSTLQNLSKYDEAETNFKKAIELKPDYEAAHHNLDILLKEKHLLSIIFKTRKYIKKNKVSSIESSVGLTSNPYITHRNVEVSLLKDFYSNKFKKLDETRKRDARYGNGKCSDFKFFKNDSLIIKNIEADLIGIMKKAVNSDIHIFDSFLNIFQAGSGTTPHTHITNFDKTQGFVKQKYSLTYYLSVGDQDCSQPGNLQLYSPYEEIKLSEGMVVINPADRKHCAVYNGKKDRVMIGVNFYSLL